MRFWVALFALLFLLPACAGTFDSLDTGPSLADTGDKFSEAMRWRDYQGAGIYLQPELLEAFLEQFPEDDDFHVLDSYIAGIKFDAETGATVLDYRLQYYRLPSMRVKKWSWAQQWKKHTAEGLKADYWLIENPPPPLP